VRTLADKAYIQNQASTGQFLDQTAQCADIGFIAPWAIEHSALGKKFKAMWVTAQTSAHFKFYRGAQSPNSWLPWNGFCAHPFT
jgi:hypothetical protein